MNFIKLYSMSYLKLGNSFDDKIVLKRLAENFPKRKVDLAYEKEMA